MKRYKALAAASPECKPATAQTITVPPYVATCDAVRHLTTALEALAEDLVGALVHGSVGSEDVIPYSDLDALVILKDETLRNPARLAYVAKRLNRARRIMRAFDPLQHHGWFVLTAFDLDYYCDAYFPTELFAYAKALLPSQGCELSLYKRSSTCETREAFDRMTATITVPLIDRRYPTTLYEAKSLLSRFMLLPALYVQVRDGHGVWKADSFELARQDFTNGEWEAMDRVSAIRRSWDYPLDGLRGRIMRWTGVRGHRLRKRLGPTVPPELSAKLGEELYTGMILLATSMQARLKHINTLTESAP